MKEIKLLNNIFGGVLNITVDFQPTFATMDFHLTSEASSGDIEFATRFHSSMTGSDYQDSKDLFQKELNIATTKNITSTISIYYLY